MPGSRRVTAGRPTSPSGSSRRATRCRTRAPRSSPPGARGASARRGSPVHCRRHDLRPHDSGAAHRPPRAGRRIARRQHPVLRRPAVADNTFEVGIPSASPRSSAADERSRACQEPSWPLTCGPPRPEEADRPVRERAGAKIRGSTPRHRDGQNARMAPERELEVPLISRARRRPLRGYHPRTKAPGAKPLPRLARAASPRGARGRRRGAGTRAPRRRRRGPVAGRRRPRTRLSPDATWSSRRSREMS